MILCPGKVSDLNTALMCFHPVLSLWILSSAHLSPFMHSRTSVLLLNSFISSWHLWSKWLMVGLKGWTLQGTGMSLQLTSCSSSVLFWSCHQLYSFMSLLGNMILSSDLPSWPACLIPEQHSSCMGTPWSAQLLLYLLFLPKRSCIPKYDQQSFPCHLPKYLSLHRSPSCPPLSFSPRVRQWFLTVVTQWCCKQGGCAEPSSPVAL